MAKNKIIALVLALLIAVSSVAVMTGCNQNQSAKASANGDYFSHQEVRDSPEWVTKLDAAKDAEQMIVIAGVDKTTAYITMHEKNKDGK